jgi:CHASE3 domain sensor protein
LSSRNKNSFSEAYEKQMRTLTSDNDKLKQHFHQTERMITQLKRENEELQLKVNNKKRPKFN